MLKVKFVPSRNVWQIIFRKGAEPVNVSTAHAHRALMNGAVLMQQSIPTKRIKALVHGEK